MSARVKKRRLSTPAEEDNSSSTLDIEDTLMLPPSSSKMRGAVAAFAYSGRSTRSVSKRFKAEGPDVKMEREELNAVPLSPIKKGPDFITFTRTLNAPTTTASALSPRKSKPIQMDLVVPHPEPKNWKKAYDLIEEMRKEIVAPVDTMGCASAMLEETDPRTQRFGTLISLMLSSQTKDATTAQAVANLRTALGQLTAENLINAEDAVIQEAIAKVGFWRRKTTYIKQVAQILRDKYDSDVPKTIDELCALPGVGPKMSFLLLQTAWNINIGIGVDVHVHRITNRLGWHNPPTSTPERTSARKMTSPKKPRASASPSKGKPKTYPDDADTGMVSKLEIVSDADPDPKASVGEEANMPSPSSEPRIAVSIELFPSLQASRSLSSLFSAVKHEDSGR
ncbi:DNA N-glycosylase and apurinic/apyrimidinic (AP) lyase [Tulasnella sp. 330]|nr:DNA N-glycosylase and apurinic/apyrimidinic (AP) lyase [Tulasnella sp. 330]